MFARYYHIVVGLMLVGLGIFFVISPALAEAITKEFLPFMSPTLVAGTLAVIFCGYGMYRISRGLSHKRRD